MKSLSSNELNKLQYDNLVNLKTNYHKIFSFDLDVAQALKLDIEKSTNQILDILKTQQILEGSIKGNSVAISKSLIKSESVTIQSSSSVGCLSNSTTACGYSNSESKSSSSGVSNTNTTVSHNLSTAARQRRELAINMVSKIEYNWGVDCDGNVITFVSLMDSTDQIYKSVVVEGSSYFDILISLENNYISNLTINESSLYKLENLNNLLENIQKIIDVKLNDKVLSQRKTKLGSLKSKLNEKTQELNNFRPVYFSNYKKVITSIKVNEDDNLNNLSALDIKSDTEIQHFVNSLTTKLLFYVIVICLSSTIGFIELFNGARILIELTSFALDMIFILLFFKTLDKRKIVNESLSYFYKSAKRLSKLESEIKEINAQIDTLDKLIYDSERH